MRKTAVATLLILSCFPSCAQRKMPKVIRQQFTHCITGESTGLSNRLDINGYFESVEIKHWASGYGKGFSQGDSTFRHIIFYEDGLCYNRGLVFHTSQEAAEHMVSLGMGKDVLHMPFQEADGWGVYKLVNDTIVVQTVNRSQSANDAWTAWEEKFFIEDRSTIRPLNQLRPLFNQRSQKPVIIQSWSTARFIEKNDLPPSNSWIKRDSSFYCKSGN